MVIERLELEQPSWAKRWKSGSEGGRMARQKRAWAPEGHGSTCSPGLPSSRLLPEKQGSLYII